MIQDLLVRRQFSPIPDNLINVNVQACSIKLALASKNCINLLNQIEKHSSKMLFWLVCPDVFGTDCSGHFVLDQDAQLDFYSGSSLKRTVCG
jgi:hypothetical protein